MEGWATHNLENSSENIVLETGTWKSTTRALTLNGMEQTFLTVAK